MNALKRTTLTLSKKENAETDIGSISDDRPVVLDFIEVLLPCRKFSISYKVSEKGAVSLTSEFVLRLLYSVDGMDEVAIASFFGFDNRELTFVMTEVISRDYVSRHNGRAWLTETGRLLFTENDLTPQILKVEKKTRKVGFDLLSLSPQESEKLSRFALKLPELPIQDVEFYANASKYIPKSFQKHFSEIVWTKVGADKQGVLYSVDAVYADNKFSAIVPILISSSQGRPSSAEPNLTNWKTGHELDDRSKVIEAISKHIHELEVSKRPDDAYSYKKMVELAPEFFEDFLRKDGLSIERYFKAARTRVGDLRSDRQTVPLIGTLFTPDNNARLTSAIDYGLKSIGSSISPNTLFWVIPDVSWGNTQALPYTLDLIKEKILKSTTSTLTELSEEKNTGFECIALTKTFDRRSNIGNAFSRQNQFNEHLSLPPSLEILYIPNILVACLVHAPLMVNQGFPVPLGFLSFDQNVIGRTSVIIDELIQR
ncbi:MULTISPECIES: hypothetical protein [unclassified Methylophilus]|uniref:hypothetical protein n=1 Tax=unclassified Methylophilus TaxID=2630143 RepID=UPI0006FCCC9D|nr:MULTISPECIES: hypothetical protein [unclassified Methylophilus]KQT41195.1 hypothetical protein ASG34_10570 [Methylophilus sp. Leaf416]KQT58405.1 hypothetical protein ASG44_12125 [Methylophilus sp. Leaf459]